MHTFKGMFGCVKSISPLQTSSRISEPNFVKIRIQFAKYEKEYEFANIRIQTKIVTKGYTV